jgi:hypothetical protein
VANKTWLPLLAIFLSSNIALASSKRPPQDYGGPPPPSVGPSLLWAPRVVLFPLWLTSEYVIRRPIGALVRTAEKNQWPEEVISFFTFGERHNVTLFPSALIDFGLKPSVGFNLGWKYFLAEPNTLNVHFGTWGPDWVSVKARDQYALDKRQTLGFEGAFVRRRDLPFFGMGPRSPSDPRYRYQAMTSELALGYENDFWRASSFVSRTGMRSLSFGDAGCCAEPPLADAVDSGVVASPPGYRDGYVAEFQSLFLAVDSRRPAPDNGTGVRIEGHGSAVFSPAGHFERRAWVDYGGAAGVAFDLWKARILGFGVRADFVDPIIGTIPFTDRVALGGNRPMRGFLRGRLIDRSALVATAQYTWPVWVYLNGVLQVDVGNVFGEHLNDFSADLLRMSTAIGIRSSGPPESGLEIMVAGGTDPFEEGFNYSSFRLVLGSHHGF